MAQRRRPNHPAAGNPRAPSAGRNTPATQFPLALLVCFLPLAIGFAVLYFVDAPLENLAQRRASLVFLLAPDHLLELWCGGKLGFFSVFDRWPIVLLAATILLTGWLAGRLLLLGLGVVRLLDRLEQLVFAVGAGLNLVSLYALAVGLAGGLQQRWLFAIPIVALVAANLGQWLLARSKLAAGMDNQGAIAAEDRAEDRDQVWSRLTEDNNPRWYWWLLGALPFAVVIVLGAMLPPWDYDVREYHLQAPKEWYQNGRIDFLPHNIYANMPLGSELTGLWAMALSGGKDGWWWGALAGKTVMACYSLVSAAALIAFGRRLHSVGVGVVAAIVYVCVPWTATLAMAGYNEGPVGLYALLSIFAIWLANQKRPWGESVRLIGLAGFCAGSAVACKYPPLLFVVVPLTAWLLFRPLRGREAPDEPRALLWQRFIYPSVFVAAMLAACGLWFAKNWALTNNPTYPLLYSVFDGRTRTPEKNRQWMTVHSPQPDNNGNRFSPRQFVDQLTWNLWRTRLASLCIPPLAAMAWFARDKRRWLTAVICWMGFVFVAWWLTTHRLDRFLVLMLPLASLVAAIGVFAIPHPAWRLFALGFVVLAALAHFPFITLQPDNRYFAPLAMLRRDDRELSLQGLRVESAHRWLNEHARPGEKVLLLGDAEPFDLELPAVYNTCFDDCQFTRIFQGRSRAERLAALREAGIDYVFCSWAHLARFRSPGNYGYTSDYPTPELVHNELVRDEKLLIPIEIEADPQSGELFRVADE
jgi:hypothetical protein